MINPDEIIQLELKRYSGAVGRRPFALARAEGAKLWDAQGREYIDCSASHGWANVGHSHPLVTQAIQRQAGIFVTCHEGAYTEQRALWMRDLSAILPAI